MRFTPCQNKDCHIPVDLCKDVYIGHLGLFWHMKCFKPTYRTPSQEEKQHGYDANKK